MKKRQIWGAVIASVFLLSTVVWFMINSKADASLDNHFAYDGMEAQEHLNDAEMIVDDSSVFIRNSKGDVSLNNNVDEMATEEGYMIGSNVEEIADDTTIFLSN